MSSTFCVIIFLMTEEKEPLYPLPEDHPHYGDARVDHTKKSDDRDGLPLVNDSSREVFSPPAGPKVRIDKLTVKRKQAQRITLNEGTRDEIKLIGRVYGVRPGVVFRSSPAETRDAQIEYISNPNDFFFKVNGQDKIQNGVAHFWGFVGKNNGVGLLPTLNVPRPVVARVDDIRHKKA